MALFSSNAKESEKRLKKVLISDKHFNPEAIKKVVKSDIYYLLNNYAEILPDNLDFNIEINEQGDYIFKIVAKCSRIKIFGSLPD